MPQDPILGRGHSASPQTCPQTPSAKFRASLLCDTGMLCQFKQIKSTNLNSSYFYSTLYNTFLPEELLISQVSTLRSFKTENFSRRFKHQLVTIQS